MKPKVWMERNLAPDFLLSLEAVAEVIQDGDMADLPGADAIVIGSLINADGAFMDEIGPTLKVIARPGIGIDNVNLQDATDRGIFVVHTPDAPTEATAEHAVALLLSIAKHVGAGISMLRGTDISRPQLLGTEVRGKVLGIIGFGRIGSRVAQICKHGLGMRVLAYDPYLVDRTRATSLGVELAENMNSLLAEADFVTLHAALTPETRHLIGEMELRHMKQGAYLVNVSRGPVVDEVALIRVLQEGHLAGAGLDVFDPEPPLSDNPLLQMPNVIATPHTAAFTAEGLKAMSAGIVDQILQVLRGEQPTFLVNPAAWPGRAGKT
jgi:D-3-phosphoglycerate dehydrogenase